MCISHLILLDLYFFLVSIFRIVIGLLCFFFFSSRRRHTRCALVTGVQTCALPIYSRWPLRSVWTKSAVIELVDLRCDCTDASAFADWAIAGTAAPRPAAASGASVQAARRVIVFLVIWLSFSFLQPAFRIRALNPR